jgi:uncharacterized protein (UPF0212 family)
VRDYGCIVHQIKNVADQSLVEIIKNDLVRFSNQDTKEIEQSVRISACPQCGEKLR